MTRNPEDADAESDMKRKFKEALEQKSMGPQARKAHQEGRTKVGALQGPATRKRNFRRKTG
jgi:hypothetical protein